jgi:DNA-binding beta-propeller fold protein YncE
MKCDVFSFVVCMQTDDRVCGAFVRAFTSTWNGLVYSADGEFLVVSDYATSSVQVLRASDRSLVRAMRQGTLTNPGRLAISPDGNTVFVSDLELDAVFQYQLDGTLVRRIGSQGETAGKFDTPRGLAVSKSGELFVADLCNHRVQVFRVSDGTFLRQIGGSKGKGNGQFILPMDVALSPDETELLVVDMGNHRIQVVRARDGQYLRQWGSRGSKDGQFDTPQSVLVTGSGEVLVADRDNHRVCTFDMDGTFRRSIGQGSRASAGPGQLIHPVVSAYDPIAHEMLVVQAGTDYTEAGGRARVQVFR